MDRPLLLYELILAWLTTVPHSLPSLFQFQIVHSSCIHAAATSNDAFVLASIYHAFGHITATSRPSCIHLIITDRLSGGLARKVIGPTQRGRNWLSHGYEHGHVYISMSDGKRRINMPPRLGRGKQNCEGMYRRHRDCKSNLTQHMNFIPIELDEIHSHYKQRRTAGRLFKSALTRSPSGRVC